MTVLSRGHEIVTEGSPIHAMPLVCYDIVPNSEIMLDWLLGRVHDTKHAGSVLRAYLWWGLFVRAVLLFAMLTLLVVKGNFLAKWLLTLQIPLVPETDVDELTAISYGVLFFILISGSAVRWGLLQRLQATVSPSRDGPEEVR